MFKKRYRKLFFVELETIGSKVYEEFSKVKHLCAHMDISIEEILLTIMNVTFIKRNCTGFAPNGVRSHLIPRSPPLLEE